MSEFQLAAAVLLAGLAPCAWVCFRRGFADAVAAVQLAGTLAALALLVISEAEARQPFADLAIVLAAVSFVGSLLMARFLGESR